MADTISLEYFAWVREKIGKSQETLALEGSASVATILTILIARGGGYAQALAEQDKLRFAVNQNYVADNFVVNAGDTLAIFPPVTGG